MKILHQKSLDAIEMTFKWIQIDFIDKSWRDYIPPKPGWYCIETNTPIEVLKP